MKSIIAFQKIILSLLLCAWVNISFAQQKDSQSSTETKTSLNTWLELGTVMGKGQNANNRIYPQQQFPYSIHDLIHIQRDALLKFQRVHPYFHSPKFPYTVPKKAVKEGARVLKA